MTLAIDIKALRKTYKGPFEAVKGIDLEVKKGDFFGLLGPNGAGKSTTIGILCGLINKTSGHVSINDFDIDTHPLEAKQQLGVVPQEFNFNIFEPCIQIVVNQAGYYGVPAKIATNRAHSLFKELGLTEKTNTPAGQLSGGLKRRLLIARALVHDPSIIILDEPTAGVDISLRRSMWAFIEKLNKSGKTIILTTHYLEEAEALCKNLAIIDKGKIIEKNSTSELLKRLNVETVIFYCNTFADTIKDSPFKFNQIDQHTIEATLDNTQTISSAVAHLNQQNIVVNRIKNKTNRLEELFVNITESI